jgi:hypothetical protein
MDKSIVMIDSRNDKKCNYYNDFIFYLNKVCKKLRVLPYNNEQIELINKINPDVIIIGFGITDCGNNIPRIPTLNNINCSNVYIILNKEYAVLDKKLNWIKNLKPLRAFSVHHDVDLYEQKIQIPFTRIMWSAREDIFCKKTDIYKYDLFFSGIIRAEQADNMRNKIYDKMNELSEYNCLIRAAFYKNNKLIGRLYTFKLHDYANQINNSKIALTTTGPADLVGTRYFEIMATNKALIMCNRMPEKIYEDIVIDGFNCVMFDDENDFIKKCKYYLTHEDERIKIVNQAYEHFLKKHMWKHKIQHFLEFIK